ncbi:MAG: sulfotransferase [Alphaproteobacteria bacterium]|nr:sulfotransferase [Alphaproteobacteria bacterium]
MEPTGNTEATRGTEPTGNLATALDHASALLARDPKLAEQQVGEILKVVPGQPHALLLLARARLAQGNIQGAREILEPLAKAHPNAAATHHALGEVLAALGDSKGAIKALKRATELQPQNAHAWRKLGDQLVLIGDTAGADTAYALNIKASVHEPKLIEAATALVENRLAVAERLLREFLKDSPNDVAAIRMLAETGARLGAYEDAENLLARALELNPAFAAARHNYAMVLHKQMKSLEAVAETDKLLADDPANPSYRALKSAALVRIGEYPRAIESYEALLKEHPELPKAWMSYAHCLKTVGRTEDSLACYRKSIAMLPSLGEAYWSMANLKTFRFTDDEVAAMQAQLARGDIADEDRYHLHFALGKALEDKGEYEASFEHYAQGNALRRKDLRYDAATIGEHVARTIEVFSPAFLKSREGWGSPAPDPIFVVSLPRSGSTLIEQILASHSMVEGTMELPDIHAIARGLEGRKVNRPGIDYPLVFEKLAPERLRELGEEYLRRASVQRKSGRPFFVDKMPNNFLHLGFIHLILPNAKIVDARRNPMACCFSNFKQHFARGQGFAYDLADIGRYWRDYAKVMAHFDAALPGRVHRVFYEDMVADPETQIRALLDYCGLPFEETCLRYYETDRAVRTASSEQVRRPIFTDQVEQWRHYEEWLEPLKTALGDTVDAYPGVPDFTRNP